MSSEQILPNGWYWSTLDDIRAPGRSVVSGPFGSNIGSRFFVASGVPVIRGGNLTTGMDRFREDNFVFLTSEKAAEFSSCEAIADDLIFTAAGTIGQVGLIPKRSKYQKYIISNKQLRARLDTTKVDPEFAYYWFASPIMVKTIQSRNTGSTIPLINLSVLKSLPVPVPPLNEQREIANCLSAFDNRIALLRETNTTLEAIAQALFKSWFVDFDPVYAKQQGIAPAGMDDATAALFPDGFEESALGLVPRGWRPTKLGDVCTYLSRGISPKYCETGGVLVINQKCVRDFSVDVTKARRHDHEQKRIGGRELNLGDVLVNSTGVGTLGRVAQVLSLEEICVVDSHVTVLRAGLAIGWPYLGQLFIMKQPEIEAMGEGSTGQTELSRGKLAEMLIVAPTRSVLDSFDAALVPLQLRIAANSRQAQTLATVRDTLLPRLISGQLRLPEAEEQLAEAIA